MNKHLAKAIFLCILLKVSVVPSEKCNFKHFIVLQLVLKQTYTKDLKRAAAIVNDVEGADMQLLKI
jgi:hypothetical protein